MLRTKYTIKMFKFNIKLNYHNLSIISNQIKDLILHLLIILNNTNTPDLLSLSWNGDKAHMCVCFKWHYISIIIYLTMPCEMRQMDTTLLGHFLTLIFERGFHFFDFQLNQITKSFLHQTCSLCVKNVYECH